jgi:hypothetical protein
MATWGSCSPGAPVPGLREHGVVSHREDDPRAGVQTRQGEGEEADHGSDGHRDLEEGHPVGLGQEGQRGRQVAEVGVPCAAPKTST